MASSGVLKLASLMLVVCMVVSATLQARAAVTCGDVMRDLTPCVSYVQYGGPLPNTCCNGVKTLYGEAQTSADRQNVCKCIKSAVNGFSYSNFNLGQAAGLPGKCGLHLPYTISPSTDCNKVQ
ncbi:non-specific lipid-transfer protein 3-like [Herrania umbratica]|uniref:Non-specific lipid-transfer protein n=1 Tax=Herrania umbratica TaxID=108875 RepID=A0A6J1AWG6_9ROSI|nr:non-specific lipid-transfer protein 3-like [Herrania umbratica]